MVRVPLVTTMSPAHPHLTILNIEEYEHELNIQVIVYSLHSFSRGSNSFFDSAII